MLLIILFLLDLSLVLSFALSSMLFLACMGLILAVILAVLIVREWQADKKFRELKARINQ